MAAPSLSFPVNPDEFDSDDRISFSKLDNKYIAVQDDIPEGWSLTNTLIFFGLRALAPGAHNKANPPTAEEAKEMFAEL